ncbi:MAG: hypothetical protein IJD59_01935, partial [Clostridia bacterium]|nr:hypothetical protein [Clostridia bacterium]
ISLSLCDNITLCFSKEYHLIPTEKERAFRLEPICSLFLFVYGFGLSPFAVDRSNAMLALSGVFKFSVKDSSDYSAGMFLL